MTNYFYLIKVSKMTSNIPTCSKLVSNHLRSNHIRSNHLRSNYKKDFFVYSMKMPNDGNKNMYEERLLSSLNESGSVEGSGKNFDDVRIELIKKDSNE